MPKCRITLLSPKPETVTHIIKRIALEQFRARDAYPLDNGNWNIDAGKNDVRAKSEKNSNHISFFCRYEKDLPVTESKITQFAEQHGIEHTEAAHG